MLQRYATDTNKTNLSVKKVCNRCQQIDTFVAMKELTTIEAWEHFWGEIKTSPEWPEIPREEKQYLYKAAKAAREGRLGERRIISLLNRYAPGRYEFRQVVVLKG